MKMVKNVKMNSLEKLDELTNKMSQSFSLEDEKFQNICVYACGSLGRLEMTQNSDLDLFFVSMNDGNDVPMQKNLNKYLFFSELYRVTSEMGFPEPSKQGEYWIFASKDDLLDIGSRKEDFNNSFTTRLLLILESKPLYNAKAYNQLVNEIVMKYFVDYEEHQEEFYPLFLMNDILRYWYTLTLNYEYRRDDRDDINKKNWKRLKLKYARLITCFSMLACLYRKNITPDYVIECVKKTPIERLITLGEDNEKIKVIVDDIIEEYEWFLSLRQSMENGLDEDKEWENAFARAEKFHNLVINKLMGEISQAHPQLRNKTDVY